MKGDHWGVCIVPLGIVPLPLPPFPLFTPILIGLLEERVRDNNVLFWSMSSWKEKEKEERKGKKRRGFWRGGEDNGWYWLGLGADTLSPSQKPFPFNEKEHINGDAIFCAVLYFVKVLQVNRVKAATCLKVRFRTCVCYRVVLGN